MFMFWYTTQFIIQSYKWHSVTCELQGISSVNKIEELKNMLIASKCTKIVKIQHSCTLQSKASIKELFSE